MKTCVYKLIYERVLSYLCEKPSTQCAVYSNPEFLEQQICRERNVLHCYDMHNKSEVDDFAILYT